MKASAKQREWLGVVSKMMADNFQDSRVLSQVTGPNNSILEFWQVSQHGLVIIQYWVVGGFEYFCRGYDNRLAQIPDDIRDMCGVTRQEKAKAI